MKLSEAERELAARLQTIYGAGEAAAIAALAIGHLTELPKGERLLRGEETLSAARSAAWQVMVERLLRHEPLQYVTNSAPFYGMTLYVDKDVLIPRPETEELVHWIIGDVQQQWGRSFQKKQGEADATTALKILDVGTGSGCIALALKKALPLAEVWGCDNSDKALNVARRNGAQLDIRVDFQSADFLLAAQQKHLPTVDVLVSNPPYIPQSDKASMQPNVLQYEPHTALFVPDDDPLVFYKAILEFSRHRLYENGTVYLEIHEDRADAIRTIFEEEAMEVLIRKDMQGKDRIARIRKAARG